MTETDEKEVKAQIWQLDTVNIRKVLRWLNNNIRKTIEATILAAARHEVCHSTILANYSAKEMYAALQWLKSLEKPEFIADEKVQDPDQPNYALAVAVRMVDDTLSPSPFNKVMEEERPPTTEVKGPPYDPMTTSIRNILNQDIDKALNIYDKHRVVPNLKALEKFEKLSIEFGKTVEKRITLVEDAIMASQSNQLTIIFPDADKKDLGLVHKTQALLIKYLMAGCHVFLTGPAGSGKSTGGEKAAEALGLKFGAASCCSQDTATKFMGYMDATGNYHTTEFREAYVNGGIFLLDEVDAGNPNVLAVLNSALSNQTCAFPDGMVKRHEKFRCVATGNTWGTGKTIQYVGRNAIDAATLNRFVVIYWDYDEALETRIAGMPAWSKYVQECRKELSRRGINFLVTPRASIFGARALKTGISLKDVIDNVLFPNLDPEVKKLMPPVPQIAEIK